MAKRRWLSRDSVVARAVEMADTAGAAEVVTLTALAAALDVRVPSLYNHVAGLEDLYQGMAVYGARQLLGHLRAAAAGQPGRDALLAMAAAYRGFAREHPGLYPLTIRAPDPGEEALASLAQELLQLLLLVLASAGFHGGEALHAVRGFRALLHGFVSLESGEGFKMSLDQEQSFHHLVNTYLDGLMGSRTG